MPSKKSPDECTLGLKWSMSGHRFWEFYLDEVTQSQCTPAYRTPTPNCFDLRLDCKRMRVGILAISSDCPFPISRTLFTWQNRDHCAATAWPGESDQRRVFIYLSRMDEEPKKSFSTFHFPFSYFPIAIFIYTCIFMCLLIILDFMPLLSFHSLFFFFFYLFFPSFFPAFFLPFWVFLWFTPDEAG